MSKILGENEYNMMRKSLDALAEIEKEALLAQKAGIDVSDALKKIQENKAKLSKMLETYFPARK